MKKYKKQCVRELVRFLNFSIYSAEPVLDEFSKLNNAVREGFGSSQFVYVPGTRPDRVVLVAHADTVWDNSHYTTYNRDIGIGADDRAGCAILWLMKDSGHSLLVLNGEESGMIGADYLIEHCPKIKEEINSHQFMVELDRRNAKDFKCYNVGTPEFREYLKTELKGYKEPDVYSFTDIVTLCHNIPGVNLSVGYYNEHTGKEYINVNEWYDTFATVKQWLSKKNLPKFDYVKQSKYSMYSSYEYYGREYDDFDYYPPKEKVVTEVRLLPSPKTAYEEFIERKYENDARRIKNLSKETMDFIDDDLDIHKEIKSSTMGDTFDWDEYDRQMDEYYESLETPKVKEFSKRLVLT